MSGTTDILLIRHAPVSDGRLAGRRDLCAVPPAQEHAARVAGIAGPVDHLLASPAQRCRVTAEALFPGRPPEIDPRLWEQDFGDWEGMAPRDIPDLGPLPPEALAAHRPPGGESFADLRRRTRPALCEAAGRGGRLAVVAHAGTVRAALALALGAPGPALAFEVEPLSVTLIRARPGAGWSVAFVNRMTRA